MGKITGFLEIDRHDRKYAPVAERVKSYREFVVPLSEKDTRDQAARCMDCGGQNSGRARPRSRPQPFQFANSNAPIKDESQSFLSK